MRSIRCSVALCALVLCGCPSGGDGGSTPAVTGAVTGAPATAAPASPSTTASAVPAASGQPMSLPRNVTIETNTQATLDDVRIGTGNFWEEEYTDEAGKKQKGLTAGLWVFERDPPKEFKLRAFPGKKFTASKMAFEVLRVNQSSVELKVSAASP